MCDWLQHGGWFDGTSYKKYLACVRGSLLKSKSNVSEKDADIGPDEPPPLSFKTGKYPENFENIVKVFDTYVNYYISNYNDLIDYIDKNIPSPVEIFAKTDSKEFNADDFKIPHPKMKRNMQLTSNELFQYAARLQADIAAYDTVADMMDKDTLATWEPQSEYDYPPLMEKSDDIKKIATKIQHIEVKLNALLKHLGKNENDFDALLNLEGTEKLMCIFKTFISSVGRKPKGGKNFTIGQLDDELGNMVICAPVEVENSRLAQMITDFYLKKDNCAYIQIEDKAYIFDERHNPLGLQDLPLFKDAVTKFVVKMFVSDSLKNIRLRISAVKPDKNIYAGKTSLSFVPSHPDFICKVLKKPIEVRTKLNA